MGQRFITTEVMVDRFSSRAQIGSYSIGETTSLENEYGGPTKQR
jgi:hypothetical protein